jgi:hypothetical protein
LGVLTSYALIAKEFAQPGNAPERPTALPLSTFRAARSGGRFPIVRGSMRFASAAICIVATCSAPIAALAADVDFSGTWVIDLRSPAERKNKVECGSASFKLIQTGEKITGDHIFATPGCGRLNEGGEGSVKGVAVGTAVQVDTPRAAFLVRSCASRKPLPPLSPSIACSLLSEGYV